MSKSGHLSVLRLGRRALGRAASPALLIGLFGCSGTDAEGSGPVGAFGSAPGTPEMPAAAGAPSSPGPAGMQSPGASTPASSEGTPDVTNATANTPGSPPATGSGESMPPAGEVPPMLTPGPGFFTGGSCVPPCTSDATDPDAAGVRDGFGFELGASCIVPGSPPALAAIPCLPEVAEPVGDGYKVSELCVPACTVNRLADAQGYGFEAQQTCVVEGSTAALQAARCVILPREGLPAPGDGFQLQEGCFARCVNPPAAEPNGFGFEQERPCIVAGSDAALQGVPCIPPPADVIGFCPDPIQCPVANGVELSCGCGFQQGGAERKRVIMNTPGASQYFLASAMMETRSLTADYPLGDVFPNGANKTGDAFNGGIAKQNWGMMRRCHPAWTGLGGGNFLTGVEVNNSLALDIQVYNECRQMFGNDWWGGHRLGFDRRQENSADVQRFKAAMDWTNGMLAGHLADDVFFFVIVPAI